MLYGAQPNLAHGLHGPRTDLERSALPPSDPKRLRLARAAARLADVLVVALIFTVLA